MKSSSKALVEGALFSGIFIILVLVSLYVPIVGLYTIYIIPIPIIIYFYRNSLKYGLIMLFTNSFIAFMISPLHGLISVLFANISGGVYGILLKKKNNPIISILTLGLIFTVELILIHSLSNTIFGYDVLDQIYTMLNHVGNFFNEIFGTNWFIDYFVKYIPDVMFTLLFMVGMANAFIIYTICGFIFHKLGYPFKTVPSLITLRLPKYLTILHILLLIAVWVIKLPYILTTIIMNLYLLLFIIFFINGIGVVMFFVILTEKSNIFRFLIILSIYILITIPIYYVIGLLESVFKLKERIYISTVKR